MKKIFLISIVLFFSSALANNYENLCTKINSNKNFQGNFASLSGFNSLARNIIEFQISKAIKKETDSSFKIKINNFYGNNILNGEFKSLNATGKSLYLDGFYFSNLNIKTICPYNKIGFKDSKIIFYEPMILEYSANISQEDIDKFTNSSIYKNIIEKINSDNAFKTFGKIKNSNIQIKNNKLSFNFEIVPKLFSSKTIKISLGANIKINNEKIELYDDNTKSLKNIGLGAILPLINSVKPTQQEIEIDKNKKGKLVVNSAKIIDSKIEIKGNIIIPKEN